MRRCHLLLAILLPVLIVACERESELPKLYRVPSIELVSDRGKRVHLDELRGSAVVFDFIFTSCSGICPAMSARMSELQRDIDRSLPVRFVSVSVDPARDTPEVLNSYARKFRHDDRWIFLTGPRESVIALSIDGFKLAAGDALPGGEPILHSSRFVLVDRKGMVRGYYDSGDPDAMKKLRGDLVDLANEDAA